MSEIALVAGTDFLVANGALTLVLDGAGLVLAVSPSITGMLGWPPSELIGGNSVELVHPADRGEVYRARADLVRTGRSALTVRVRRSIGGWRVLAVTAFSLPPASPPHGSVVIQAFDITERWRREQSLAHDAAHDPLTQLPNRRSLMDRLREARARQDRHGGVLAVCYVDVDGLKQVNDTHGHDAGDRLLQDTATALRAGVRTQDHVARLGGDEYAILVEDLTEASAEHVTRAVLERVTELLEQLSPAPGMNGVAASIGINYAAAHDGRTPTELLAAADTAMYRQKQLRRTQPSTTPSIPEPTPLDNSSTVDPAT